MNRVIEKIKSGKTALIICMILAGMVWGVFGQTLRYGFVNYDDNLYVYENPAIERGVTTEGLHWVLTHSHVGNWHPLTSLSHMLDVELYGLHPGGHHLTSVLLHMATSILLFLVLRSMTGSLWRSAFVTAVFAIHPLRVESVAWISERKDVLSGLFFMLTLGAYLRYVRRPFSAGRYVLVLFLFAMGLLSKPMLVTLPFVLLLLDFWPLGRLKFTPSFSAQNAKRIFLEKIPFLLLSALFCGTTVWAQQQAVISNARLSVPWRLGNALCSYATYIRQTLFPAGLTVFYPHPNTTLPLWQTAISLIVLIGISLAVLILCKKRPCLLVGWLWYVGMLIPVIGIMQVGEQAHADRYTYLPQIGLVLILTWLVADRSAGWRHRRLVCGSLATLILTALTAGAWVQTSHWRDSQTLWRHALAHTVNNAVAHNNLGLELAEQEEGTVQAIEQYQRALRINPDYAIALSNLGNALVTQGNPDTAIEQYLHALRVQPDSAEIRYNLGIALAAQGKANEAIKQYQRALRINPDHTGAHNNLGNELAALGKTNEAIEQYQYALRINPDHAEARNNLGAALAAQGKTDEAIEQYRHALRINPNYIDALNNLGAALVSQGKTDETIELYQRALQIDPDQAAIRCNLGRALAMKGKTVKAIEEYQRALQTIPDNAEAHCILGLLFALHKNFSAALEQYNEAIRLNPNQAGAKSNLAWLLATCPDASLRDGKRALELALFVNQLSQGGNVTALDTLAAAYAETGQFPEAVTTARRAIDVAAGSAAAESVRERLRLYEKELPYREK